MENTFIWQSISFCPLRKKLSDRREVIIANSQLEIILVDENLLLPREEIVTDESPWVLNLQKMHTNRR